MLLQARCTKLFTQTLLHILPLTWLHGVIPSHAVRVLQWKRTHTFAYKNLLLCLLLLFLCRVRTEKKSSRERRGRRRREKPKRKCAAAAAAAMGIIWCQALFPAVPPAHCASRPCRKSMACSAWVSNTTVTGGDAPTLVLDTHTCTGVALTHKHGPIYTHTAARMLTHPHTHNYRV